MSLVTTPSPTNLKEALEGPFLDGLTGQDVGELSVRV